jgi:hypothetical protein
MFYQFFLQFNQYNMLRLIFTSIISGILLISTNLIAQVGIGTTNPDSSAVLELNSTDRGFLLPRLSTVQRGEISNPAHALLIYNTTSSEIQINNGSPTSPNWANVNGTSSTTIHSITNAGDLSTIATSFEMIPGMTLSPPAGTYMVLFNGQFGLLASVPVNTEQGVMALNAAYNELIAIPITDNTHAAVFGDETLTPGVYSVAGAVSLAGTITLNGGGDPNALFIIRSGGALNSGAGTIVVLEDSARAENIYWIAEGALGLAASTIIQGTLIANNAAISAAAGSMIEGRMFSTTGAVTFGPGTIIIPSGESYIDLGVLSTFVMFTNSGAVGNTGASTIVGDIGTNLGAITGFEEGHDGNVYGPGAAPNPTNNTLVTFSIYSNGVLLENSSRTTDINTSVISLQGLVTTTGEPIDIRWHVDTGGVVIGNRILSLIKAN